MYDSIIGHVCRGKKSFIEGLYSDLALIFLKYSWLKACSFWKLIFGNAEDIRNFHKLIPPKIPHYMVYSPYEDYN